MVHPKEKTLKVREFYLILEHMERDLFSLVLSKQKLTLEDIKQILYAQLKGLYYLHSAGILHRDIVCSKNIGG